MALADQYLADKVATASPAQLTGMLFDGAVGALRGAVRLMEAEDWQPAVARSMKAQRIICELRDSLNHEVGGDLAANLHELYMWSYLQLTRSTQDKDVQAVKDVLGVMESLASTWREATLGPAQQPA